MMLCLRRADGRPDGDECTDVELDGANRLHGGREPVDLARQEHEDLSAGGTRPLGSGIDGLAILQEACRGEEQRPDEERHGVRPGTHGVRVRRDRAEREEERADREQHADPPVAILRRPPRGAACRGSGQVLAMRARFPACDHSVWALADDDGDERPETAFLCRFCFRGHQKPSVIRAVIPGATSHVLQRMCHRRPGRHHPTRMSSQHLPRAGRFSLRPPRRTALSGGAARSG